jgi:nitrogen fixation/metabolism regulation signal transduction histidine kinase
LRTRLTLALFVLALAAAAAGAVVARALGNAFWAWLPAAACAALFAAWIASRFTRPLTQVLRALSGTVTSYREGDFSMSLVAGRRDEIGDLLRAHNELADALRTQRAHLVQRELLLDTVMQNSPVAMILVDAHGRVAFANIAARQLLSDGRTLNELNFLDALSRAPAAFRDAASREGDSLFSADIEGTEETFHLSQRSFILQGRSFRLYLVKRLTRELSRQEVSTWKKLIRVLSHELNNSLGPLSSLAHTGAEIARRGDHSSLPAVFSAIAERAEHLHRFVGGYAAFAKLPAPRPGRIEWPGFVADLEQQHAFSLAAPVPERPGWFDRVQIEQAVINLLKNAHEAGGPAGAVELSISCTGADQRIEVRDRGSGMSHAVLAQALLPFYSTKRSGTGIGLALAREIAEAHGGRIQLANREGGGLNVVLELPWSREALEPAAAPEPAPQGRPASTR